MSKRHLPMILLLLAASASAARGALVITEIMADPEQTPNADWEWIEVFNPGAPYITNGTTDGVGDPSSGAFATLSSGITIPSGYSVLFNEMSTTTAHMVAAWPGTTTATWIPVTSGWDPIFNGGDQVWTNFGGMPDIVDFNPPSFPQTNLPSSDRRSLQYVLNPSDPNATTDNDNGGNWTLAPLSQASNPAGNSLAVAYGSPGVGQHTAVPEPSAAALLGLLALTFGATRYAKRNA